MNAKTWVIETLAIGALVAGALPAEAQSVSADALINKLVQKGILTEKEAQDLVAEAAATNRPASKWKISNAIKDVQLFGDVRFRYEYRGAENAPYSGSSENRYDRERFRYAVRVGIRGDLFDQFYYGLRLDTASNPRSPWITFGDDSNPTPSAKTSDGINIGQVYLGWRPTDWYEMTVGKMPMPLYTTPMVWDSDINPEGAVEKFKLSTGNIDWFANLGQFMYQDTNPDHNLPSSDTFLLTWQVGASVKLANEVSLKAGPTIYNYIGSGQTAGLNQPFSGEGLNGLNFNTNGLNQNGINDLLVLELPVQLDFKIGSCPARVFGDFAYNIYGADRARAAVAATIPAARPPRVFSDETLAYQIGVAFGNLGLVYNQTSKKKTWEARAYWQHVEQYALDVNLLDSDFLEGRGNLEGIYSAFAYSLTDNIIGTVRYGYARRINQSLGTGGANPDLPNLNPINNYHILQLDLGMRF